MMADKNEQIAFVISELAELVKKFGADKAIKILDCINAIHEATKQFPDDIREDAIQWVIDVTEKSSPVSEASDSTTATT